MPLRSLTLVPFPPSVLEPSRVARTGVDDLLGGLLAVQHHEQLGHRPGQDLHAHRHHLRLTGRYHVPIIVISNFLSKDRRRVGCSVRPGYGEQTDRQAVMVTLESTAAEHRGGPPGAAGRRPAVEVTHLRKAYGFLVEEYRSFYRDPADVDELLDVLGLAAKRGDYYRSLSGGQRQRLSVALA